MTGAWKSCFVNDLLTRRLHFGQLKAMSLAAQNRHRERHTHLEQWAANAVVPGEQLGVRCLAQRSHLSCEQFLLEPRFEPKTLGYKSDTLSIRPMNRTRQFTVRDMSCCIAHLV